MRNIRVVLARICRKETNPQKKPQKPLEEPEPEKVADLSKSVQFPNVPYYHVQVPRFQYIDYYPAKEHGYREPFMHKKLCR